MLVDPAHAPLELVDLVRARRPARSVGVIATHFHPDHVGGDLGGSHVDGLAELLAVHDVAVHVQRDEVPWVSHVTGLAPEAFTAHDPGDVIEVGSLRVTLIHTPGHTPGSQCLLVDGRLMSGDTLFIEGCGRTDLPGSDPVEMYHSLHERLAAVGDDVVLWPGHLYSSVASARPGRRARDTTRSWRRRSPERWLAMFGMKTLDPRRPRRRGGRGPRRLAPVRGAAPRGLRGRDHADRRRGGRPLRPTPAVQAGARRQVVAGPGDAGDAARSSPRRACGSCSARARRRWTSRAARCTSATAASSPARASSSPRGRAPGSCRSPPTRTPTCCARAPTPSACSTPSGPWTRATPWSSWAAVSSGPRSRRHCARADSPRSCSRRSCARWSASLGEEVSCWLEHLAADFGVDLRCDQRVVDVVAAAGGFAGRARRRRRDQSRWSSSRRGRRPTSEWLEDSGLSLDNGVVVDEGFTAAPGRRRDRRRRALRLAQRVGHRGRAHRALAERERPRPGAGARVGGRRGDRRRSRCPTSGPTSTARRSRCSGTRTATTTSTRVLVDEASKHFTALYSRDGLVTGVVSLSQPRALMLSQVLLEEPTTLQRARELAPWAT